MVCFTRRFNLAAFVALALFAVPVSAQQVGNRVVNLKIDFAAGTFWLTDVDGTIITKQDRKQGGSLDAVRDIFLDRGNVAKIYVARANPLLYRYAAKKGDPVDTADLKAASQMLNVIKTLVQSLGGGAAAGDGPGRPVSTDPAVAAAFKNHDFATAQDWTRFLRALNVDVEQLFGKADQIPAFFDDAKTDQTTVKAKVCGSDSRCTWDVDALQKRIAGSFKRLKALRNELLTVALNGGVKDAPLYAAVDMVLSQEPDAMKALAAASSFVAAVAKIDTDILLDQGATYSPVKDLPIDVTRTTVTIDGKETKDLVKYTFTFRPYASITYGFGTALVYSFVRDRSYTGVMKDGQLVISEKVSDEFVGRKIAGVFTLSPTRWVDTPWTPSVELGVNPEKGKMGIFLGVGFKVAGLFHVGAGYSAIQIAKLDGQKNDDPINSLDAIKTKPKFQTGGYAAFTISTKIGS